MRLVFYTVALGIAVTSFSLSLTALILPQWINFHVDAPFDIRTTYGLYTKCSNSPWAFTSPHSNITIDERFDELSYSEMKSATSSESMTCRPFPMQEDCDRKRLGNVLLTLLSGNDQSAVYPTEERGRLENYEWGLCESWLTARYTATLSIVFGAFAILNILVVALGGRAKRENGWKSIVGWLSLASTNQMIAFALVAHEYNVDNRFYYGARLAPSFILSTVAFSISTLCGSGLALLGGVDMTREDAYERIQD